MSEEHLKNKKIGIASTSDRYLCDEEECGFWYRDVKSAVQGLLEEIEKIANEFQVKGNNMEDEYPNHPQTIKYRGVTYIMEGTYLSSVGIEILNLIPKIKKWFSDVVKENNKDKKRCVVCGKLIEEHSIEELEKCVHSLGEPEVLRRIAKEQGWNIKFSEK